MLRGGFEAKDEVSNIDFVSLTNNRGLCDSSPVDIGSVGALEVGNDESTIPGKQSRMMLGHVSLGQHQLVALDSADVDFGSIENFAPFVAALFCDDDRKHTNLYALAYAHACANCNATA